MTEFNVRPGFTATESYVAEAADFLNTGSINISVVNGNSAHAIPISIVHIHRGNDSEDSETYPSYGYIVNHRPDSEVSIYLNPWRLTDHANAFGSASTGFQMSPEDILRGNTMGTIIHESLHASGTVDLNVNAAMAELEALGITPNANIRTAIEEKMIRDTIDLLGQVDPNSRSLINYNDMDQIIDSYGSRDTGAPAITQEEREILEEYFEGDYPRPEVEINGLKFGVTPSGAVYVEDPAEGVTLYDTGPPTIYDQLVSAGSQFLEDLGAAATSIGNAIVAGAQALSDAIYDAAVALGEAASDAWDYISGNADSDEGTSTDQDKGKPIILDLDGDGVEINVRGDVSFDMDNDGFLESTAWADVDDGFLVLDLNANGSRGAGDGVIDQTDELILSNWVDWEGATDLQALATFDSWAERGGNNDGVLSAADGVWDELHVWQDVNQNGVSDEGELFSLDELGITEINLAYDDGTEFSDLSNDVEVFGSALLGSASYTRNGVVVEGGVGDVSLSYQDHGWQRHETSNGYMIAFEGDQLSRLHHQLDPGATNFVWTQSHETDVLTDAIGGLSGAAGSSLDTVAGLLDPSSQLEVAGIIGNASDDTIDIRGASGQLVEAADGADFVRGSYNADMIAGGDGTDTVYGNGGDDIIDGGRGSDRLFGSNGDDQIIGGGSSDSLFGGNGDDYVTGGIGNDFVSGNNGVDFLEGGAGDDRLYGGEGMGFGEMHVASTSFIGDGNWNNEIHERLLADVNNDGRADIVAYGNTGVYVQFGQTDGTFSSSIRGSSLYTNANGGWRASIHERYAADVNGDGNADLVAFGNTRTFVALGNGDGTFGASRAASESFGYLDGWDVTEHERVLADVNGDGRVDIVAFGNDTVFVHFGQADGTFAGSGGSSSNFTSNNGGWNALNHERTAADVNGDGFADLVAFGSNTTIVALGRGDGTFEANQFAHADFALHDGWDVDIHERRLEDINGDGRADIVGFGNDEVYIALGQANGTFAASTTATELFTANNGGWRADDDVRDSNDIDGNGYADLIGFGDSAVWVSLQRGDFLVGGEGDDRLVGGGGSDHYVFAEGDGTDVIVDFELGIDMIQFTTPDLDFGDLSIEQSGTASLISYGDGDSIRVYGIDVAQLTDDSFVFV